MTEPSLSVEPRRPPPPFDLVVLTGFLGAGKTTLLNELLRDPGLAETLVLINEFGAIGLDHLLVEKVEGDMLVMTSGCLCCSIRGDLIAALEDAVRRFDNGRIAPFRRVIIETTGLADPAPILNTLISHPYLSLRFKLKAVVALVDAAVGDATLDAHREAVKQAAMADCLVLSKTDLVPASMADALMRRLRALNPAAPILDAVRGEATAAALLTGPGYDPDARGADAVAWLAAESYADAQGHDHHHHDVNRHDARIRAFCLRDPNPVAPAAVSLFLDLLRSTHGARLLRFKGLICLSDDVDHPLVAHGVQHIAHTTSRLDRWPDNDRTTRLVFIVEDPDQAYIESLWRAAAGEPAIDRPDATTAKQNPLAPVPGGLLS